jgi:hypothetical protein
VSQNFIPPESHPSLFSNVYRRSCPKIGRLSNSVLMTLLVRPRAIVRAGQIVSASLVLVVHCSVQYRYMLPVFKDTDTVLLKFIESYRYIPYP